MSNEPEENGAEAPAAEDIVLEIDDIEPRLHRHIIGRGGATVTQIRMATNTRIDVPRGSNIVTVRGKNQDDVDEAERMIREAVTRGSSRH